MTEGDNTVMAQQTAKYLLKKLQAGEIDLDSFEFDVKNNLTIEQQLILLFEIRFKNQLKTAAQLLQDNMDKSFQHAWNAEALNALVQTTVYFCEYWAIKNFYDLATGNKTLFAEGDKSIRNLNQRVEST